MSSATASPRPTGRWCAENLRSFESGRIESGRPVPTSARHSPVHLDPILEGSFARSTTLWPSKLPTDHGFESACILPFEYRSCPPFDLEQNAIDRRAWHEISATHRQDHVYVEFDFEEDRHNGLVTHSGPFPRSLLLEHEPGRRRRVGQLLKAPHETGRGSEGHIRHYEVTRSRRELDV